MDEFSRQVDRIVEFRAEYGCWPRQTQSSPLSDDEAFLGQRLASLRYLARKGKMSQARIDLLDSVAPGWNTPPANATLSDRQWFALVDEVASFRAEHGRWPSVNAPSKSEKRLAGWWYTNRKKTNLSQPRRTYLADKIPDFAPQESVPFEESVARYVAFTHKHGRRPRSNVAKVPWEDGEKRLAAWMRNVRRAAKATPDSMPEIGRIVLTPERVALLDQEIPQWRLSRADYSRQRIMAELAQATKMLVSFYDINGHLCPGSDPRVREALKTAARASEHGVEHPELATIARWNDANYQRQRAMVVELARWLGSHEGWPRQNQGDSDEARLENRLWWRLVRWRQGNRMTDDLQALLDTMTPGWEDTYRDRVAKGEIARPTRAHVERTRTKARTPIHTSYLRVVDGATTLNEAADRLEAFAAWLRDQHKRGWSMATPASNGTWTMTDPTGATTHAQYDHDGNTNESN